MAVANELSRAVGRVRVASRWARTLALRPEEALDRYRTRQVAAREPPTGTNDGVTEAWRRLAGAWGIDGDDLITGFSDLWDQLWGNAQRFEGRGSRHDGDVELARCLWVAVRALRPDTVIETGVGRGVSSAVILGALDVNGAGTLTSIDLPPLTDPWYRSSAELVPAYLRGRWNLIYGGVRRVLPQVLVDSEQVDLFLHDSLQHPRPHEVRAVARLALPQPDCGARRRRCQLQHSLRRDDVGPGVRWPPTGAPCGEGGRVRDGVARHSDDMSNVKPTTPGYPRRPCHDRNGGSQAREVSASRGSEGTPRPGLPRFRSLCVAVVRARRTIAPAPQATGLRLRVRSPYRSTLRTGRGASRVGIRSHERATD